MTHVSTARFAPTGEELLTIAQAVPGLALPSFVTCDGRVDGRARPRHRAVEAFDPRLLLALALVSRADAIVQLVSWSPGEVVRRSIGATGAVASTLSRRDHAATATQSWPVSGYDVALLPTAGLAAEIAPDPRVLGRGAAVTARPVEVPIASSRAMVEAARRGDPALTQAVAAELDIPAAGMRALDGLHGRFSRGVQARFFDGRSGRCVLAGDWVRTKRGWTRVSLATSAGPDPLTAQSLLEAGKVAAAPVSGESIGRSLGWMLAALIRSTSR